VYWNRSSRTLMAAFAYHSLAEHSPAEGAARPGDTADGRGGRVRAAAAGLETWTGWKGDFAIMPGDVGPGGALHPGWCSSTPGGGVIRTVSDGFAEFGV
jgi:hypothetical protein